MSIKRKATNMQFHEMIELAQQSMGAVNTLFQTLKTLREGVRIPVKNGTVLEQGITNADKAAFDLQERLLKFQSAIFALQDRISTLEKENLDLKTRLDQTQEFDKLHNMCERRTIGPDTRVMVMNEAFLKPDEPPLYLCPNCFSHKQKSELQLRKQEQHLNVMGCHNCGAEYLKSTERQSTHEMLFGESIQGEGV